MIILLTGATGFIGTQLAHGLRRAGHVVITTRRHPLPGSQELQADFARDHDPHLWVPRLRGINAVLNAVGVRRRRHQSSGFHCGLAQCDASWEGAIHQHPDDPDEVGRAAG